MVQVWWLGMTTFVHNAIHLFHLLLPGLSNADKNYVSRFTHVPLEVIIQRCTRVTTIEVVQVSFPCA